MTIIPFRWNISKRTHLGRLVRGQKARTYRGFYDDLLACCSRVLSFSEDTDLIFVGRSPESIFDHLSGLLFNTSWVHRLELLHFSMRWTDEQFVLKEYPGAMAGLRSYLSHLKLGPKDIALRTRPVTFIDLVLTGATFGNFILLLRNWAKGGREDWGAIRRKIRLLGITERKKTSPKTWRWQQHAEWVHLLGSGAIRNVSIPRRLWQYLGDYQEKVTPSHPPSRWGDEQSCIPDRQQRHLQALRLAVRLFDFGRMRKRRAQFSSLLVRETAMKCTRFRGLVRELR